MTVFGNPSRFLKNARPRVVFLFFAVRKCRQTRSLVLYMLRLSVIHKRLFYDIHISEPEDFYQSYIVYDMEKRPLIDHLNLYFVIIWGNRLTNSEMRLTLAQTCTIRYENV